MNIGNFIISLANFIINVGNFIISLANSSLLAQVTLSY